MKKTKILLLTVLFALLFSTSVCAATVCKIGSKGYSSLQKAVNAAKKGQTIVMTKAVTTDQYVDINGKKITIDFSKKKYTCKADDHPAIGISPTSTVTMKNMNINANWAFGVAGKLTLSSGKMTSGKIQVDRNSESQTGTLTIKGGTYSITKMNHNPWIVINNGIVRIQKGTFKKEADFSIQGEGKLTISNGSFTIASGHEIIANNQGGELTIQGGTFKCADNHMIINALDASRVTINGGKFYTDQPPIIQTADRTTTTITNGIFQKTKSGPAAIFRGDCKISGGDFNDGIQFFRNALLTGGKTSHSILSREEGTVIVENFTIDQGPTPPQWGPGMGNPTMIAIYGGEIHVKGGSFISPQGYGYATRRGGLVSFEVSDWEKLFNVKTLEFKE